MTSTTEFERLVDWHIKVRCTARCRYWTADVPEIEGEPFEDRNERWHAANRDTDDYLDCLEAEARKALIAHHEGVAARAREMDDRVSAYRDEVTEMMVTCGADPDHCSPSEEVARVVRERDEAREECERLRATDTGERAGADHGENGSVG